MRAAVPPGLPRFTACYAAAEALLEARPVVASRIGAIPELVEHEVSGLLSPLGDARALLEAARRAMSAPEVRHRVAVGRERVPRETEPRRHVEGLLAIYREAMSGA